MRKWIPGLLVVLIFGLGFGAGIYFTRYQGNRYQVVSSNPLVIIGQRTERAWLIDKDDLFIRQIEPIMGDRNALIDAYKRLKAAK